MDHPFPFNFLFRSVQRTFDFSAHSVSLFTPFVFCGKEHSTCVNSRFAERKFHVVNYMYVATCSHRRTRLSQLLGQTLVMVFSEYIKPTILFHQAEGYHAPTVADKLRDEGILLSRKGVSDFLLRVETKNETGMQLLNGNGTD